MNDQSPGSHRKSGEELIWQLIGIFHGPTSRCEVQSTVLAVPFTLSPQAIGNANGTKEQFAASTQVTPIQTKPADKPKVLESLESTCVIRPRKWYLKDGKPGRSVKDLEVKISGSGRQCITRSEAGWKPARDGRIAVASD